MEWPAWEPTYREILRDFGFDRGRDESARDALASLLVDKLQADFDGLRARIAGREAFVVGGAVTLDDLARVPAGAPVLVADAAASLTVPMLRPDAIVTDLDGDVALQAAANAMGVPLFVHAHGDNLPALRLHVPRLRGPLVGTTQAEPVPRVRNFGGFTDGDRACCIAAHLGAASLALVGFDFATPAAKPGIDLAVKARKLAWAERIVRGLGLPVRHA